MGSSKLLVTLGISRLGKNSREKYSTPAPNPRVTAMKELSSRHLCAFHFRRHGLTAYYDQGHLKNVVLPAIDRVLRRTGFGAESYTLEAVLMAVLGLDPDAEHVFTLPDGLFSGRGVAIVHHGNTEMYQHLPWREINFAGSLITAIFECSEYVAYNAQKLTFKILFDELSSSDRAVLFFVVNDEQTGEESQEEVIVVQIELLADCRVSIRFQPNLKFVQNRFPQFNSDGRSFSRNTFPSKPLRTCGLCGYKEKGMPKCGLCKSTFYCCVAHQNEDWRRHRTDCSRPVAALEMGPELEFKLEESGLEVEEVD
jgi:hypothetical protein